ncbi:unnamed protein product [Tenebrio molitor]|nr:unnamed protein product [Tenebrio molitor]
MGRTKTTKIITNVLRKSQKEKIVEILKKRKFSLLIDESTDMSTLKSICICVRYFSGDSGKISSIFFSLIQCFKNNPDEANKGATAETIYNKVVNALKSENTPLDNLVGFGSDGCNTMFGAQNSGVSRLKADFPGIIVQKCVSHSLHLCAS